MGSSQTTIRLNGQDRATLLDAVKNGLALTRADAVRRAIQLLRDKMEEMVAA